MSAAFDANVSITVEAAFGDDPFDTTPVWVDISAYVHSFTIDRGRSRILDETQAGRATVVLDNQDSRFLPGNTAGAYYPNVRVLTPLRIRATYSAVTYDLFRGFVTAWPQTYQMAGKRAVVPAPCIDAFRMLAMYEAELTEAQESVGTRIGNLLDTAGWPAAWRDLDTGNHQVQALTAEFNSILGEIQRCVLVDQGNFWISGNGTATYRDGDTRIEDEGAVTYTFSDDGADHPYSDVVFGDDEAQVWNTATITRSGGLPQTASDATSIAHFGERSLHLSETLHVADGEASALADWLLIEYDTIRARIQAITFQPAGNVASWPVALGAIFYERVNFERTAPSASVIDVDLHVEGISHDVQILGGRRWLTTFQLSPALPFDDWWILGTSQLGTDTRLGY